MTGSESVSLRETLQDPGREVTLEPLRPMAGLEEAR